MTGASINVRSGPGTIFPVLGRLSEGQSFPITGKNENGDWWEFDYNGKTGWVIAVECERDGWGRSPGGRKHPAAAHGRAAAHSAAGRPETCPRLRPPRSRPRPLQPRTALGCLTSELRSNSNPYVTVWCRVVNAAFTEQVPGTLRLVYSGATVKEMGSWAQRRRRSGIKGSEFIYNQNCKAEVEPAQDGEYTAYLIDGGQRISDAYKFTVSGENSRTAIVEWKQK